MKSKKARSLFLPIVFISILLFSLIVPLISPLDFTDSATPKDASATGNSFAFTKFWTGWEQGTNDLDKITVKYLFLILIAILIFSILASASFPENAIARIIISGIVSVLATFYITPDEIWGMLAAYTGLGITLGLFIPIAILLFFTIIIMVKASPMGVFFSRILWLIFSLWAIFKGLFIFLLKEGVTGWSNITSVTSAAGVTTVTLNGAVISPWLSPILKVVSANTFIQAGKSDAAIGIILLVVGLTILYVGVIKGNWMDKQVKNMIGQAEAEVFSSKMRKGVAFYRSGADALEDEARRRPGTV